MKIFLICSFILLIFLSCDSNKNSASPDGGFSAGGGGDDLPENPISAEQFEKIIYSAKKQLRLYINYQRKFNDGRTTPIEKKYFLGSENVGTHLEQVDLEVLTTEACHDRNGKEVDASRYASKPQAICISAFRLASKLTLDVANKKIISLLIHELSHLMGSSEEEAVTLQQVVIDDYTNVSLKQLEQIDQLAKESIDRLSLMELGEDIVVSYANSNLTRVATSTLEEVYNAVFYSVQNLNRLPFSYLDYVIYDYHKINLAKIKLAMLYTKSIDENNPQAKKNAEEYEKCFDGQEDVTIQDLGSKCFLELENNTYPEYRIRKILTKADLKKYLRSIFIYIHQLGAQITATVFNQSYFDFVLPGMKPEKPVWVLPFANYRVQFVSCEASSPDEIEAQWATMSKIAIFGNGEVDDVDKSYRDLDMYTKKYTWTEHFDGGQRLDILAYNGPTKLGRIHVAYEQEKTIITQISGSRWPDPTIDQWTKEVRSIEPFGDKDFKLTVRREWYANSYVVAKEGYASCQYKMTRIE